MLSLAFAVAISASIMRSVTTFNESRFKPQYFTINCSQRQNFLKRCAEKDTEQALRLSILKIRFIRSKMLLVQNCDLANHDRNVSMESYETAKFIISGQS